MPGMEEVVGYVEGVLLLARNRTEGFKWLDLSADGFWRSFAAIAYAVPALAVSWASYRRLFLQQADPASGATAGFDFVLRLALIDVLTWVLPLIVVALAAKPLGVRRHFGRFVIATNWLGAVTAYALALPSLLRLFFDDTSMVITVLSLAVFLGTIWLLYRVTRLSFEGDGMTAAIVTIGTIILSVMLTGFLQQLFGVAIA